MDLDDVEDGDGDGDDSDEDELSQGGHWSARPEMHRQRRSGRRRLHSWSLVAHTVLVHTTVPPDGTHCTIRWDPSQSLRLFILQGPITLGSSNDPR